MPCAAEHISPEKQVSVTTPLDAVQLPLTYSFPLVDRRPGKSKVPLALRMSDDVDVRYPLALIVAVYVPTSSWEVPPEPPHAATSGGAIHTIASRDPQRTIQSIPPHLRMCPYPSAMSDGRPPITPAL